MSNYKKRKMTCIVCPLGCELEVTINENGKVVSVTGNTCPQGKEYAIQEVTAPKRVVMSVIHVKNSIFPTVSVKTSKPVLKSKIPEVMKEISDITLDAPVEIGQVIVKNVAGTDADIVSTRPAPEK
ncbi:MAG: DUF1667 domain-containing protein [Thermosipho sp. (in: Bacteria)]|nr:DUF1667 domain-containing protein [Thermosipho sp. (in: thermotogales)]